MAALLDRRDATLGPMSSALRSADVAVVNLESALTSGGSPATEGARGPLAPLLVPQPAISPRPARTVWRRRGVAGQQPWGRLRRRRAA